MAGIEALSRVQMGVEAVAGGTTDPATARWMSDTNFLKDLTTVVFPKRKNGILGGTDQGYISKTGGEITLMGDATFEQLPYIFNAGIYAASVTTDTSSASIRTWTLQTADTDPVATTDLNTLVIEAGDNQQAEVMRYCFCREWTLSGAAGEPMAINAVFEGRQVGTTTFTAGIAVPTVETITFGKGYLYIDPSSDTPGTSLVSNSLLSMSLKHVTGWKAVTAKDNRLDFSFIKRTEDEMMLDLVFEHNANSVAEKANMRALSNRVLKLTFLGTALTTTDGSAAYDTKALELTLYGSWVSFDALSPQDGNNTVKGTFRVAYDAAGASKGTIKIYNELASLP